MVRPLEAHMTTTETTNGKGSGTREKVLDKLAETPGTTAGESVEAAGLGRSTVTKTLAKLERDGQARREPGGRDGKTKLPDRWHLTADGENTAEAEQDQPVSADSETADLDQEAIAEPDGDTG